MRVALLLALAVALAAAGCGGDENGEANEGATASRAGCVHRRGAVAEGGRRAHRADGAARRGHDDRLVVATNCGTFTITLDQERAPNTTASLVALARDGFFDGTSFHRVVPGFVIQGGDPTGTGAGGPGYKTVDAPPPDTRYTRGVVAMAKAESEPPGTSGSQFFIVTGFDVGLPPQYAVVGTVTGGMDTVLEIDALGVGDGPPATPVVMEDVTVEEA